MFNKIMFPSVAVFSMLAAGCSRPAECVAGKCDNQVSPATAGVPTVISESNNSTASADSKTQADPQTGANGGGGGGDPAAMNAQMQLQAMLSKLEQSVILLEGTNFEEMRNSLGSLSSLEDALESWQNAASQAFFRASEDFKSKGADLYQQLEFFASERENLRIKLFQDIEAIEATLKSALTPDGVTAQIAWDQKYLTVIDQKREQSRTQDIQTVRKDMLASADTLAVSNRNAVKSLVVDLIDKNLELVVANAPANAARALIVMSALEKAAASAPTDLESQTAISQKLDALRERLKLALDVINPGYYKQVEQLVMSREIARGTVAGLGSGIAFFKDFGNKQKSKLSQLKAEIAKLQVAAIALRAQPVMSLQNAQIIGQSLGGTIAVIDVIGQKISATNASIGEFAAGILQTIEKQDGMALLAALDPNKGAIVQQIAALEAGEEALGQAIGQVRQSLENLAIIFDAKAGCSVGTMTLMNEMPVNTVNCGNKDYTIIDAPPQQQPPQ